MDQARKVAKPARGQLNKKVKCPCTVQMHPSVVSTYICTCTVQYCCLNLFIYQVYFELGTCKKKKMPNEWRTIKSLVQKKKTRSTRERNSGTLLARKIKARTAEGRWMRNPV